MAVVIVNPTKWEYGVAVDITSASLTAFTADGIQFAGNGKNTAIFENTGASPNTVKITKYQTQTEGFPISDLEYVIPATSTIFAGKIGNIIAGNQILITVDGTPTEVKYKILSVM